MGKIVTEVDLLQALAVALRTALGDAVLDARRKHLNEHFYAYVLYTLPFYDYAVLLFNTEEGLVRIASEYDLRWSPPDWECNHEAETFFQQVNDVLLSLVRLHGNEQPQRDQRRKIFVDVLKLLDAQGLFGIGSVREAAVVNIMWGDQDVRAHIESARELNPRASYLHYARHELPTLYAAAREIETSRSIHNNENSARIRRTIAQVENDLRTVQQ